MPTLEDTAERRPILLAEHRKRIALKRLTQVHDRADVVRRQDPVRGQVRKRGAVLPHHVLVGMQAIVMKEIDLPEPSEQSGQLLLAVADDQVPSVREVSRHEIVAGGLVGRDCRDRCCRGRRVRCPSAPEECMRSTRHSTRPSPQRSRASETARVGRSFRNRTAASRRACMGRESS